MGIRFTKEKSSKLELVLAELIKLKADIVFLQETHIGPQSYKALENIKGWKSFFTVHHPRSKGVAILIKNKIKFRYICHDEDYSVGYIVLFCNLVGELYTLVNVYNHKEDRCMLKRLGDYLSAINTKGVVVVGGDFNTVLDPTIDRKSSSDQTYHSSLRIILEDFTESLNLKDIFASMHPTEEGFTRTQHQSHSRLDMFFMPTNTVKYVKNCEIYQAKMRKSTSGSKRISDHDPLVLEIKGPVLLEIAEPEVASMLSEFGYSGEPDRSAGKINGAEILSAIRSLPDSQEKTPDNLRVCDYKKNDLPMTEILKINYNMMLKSKHVPKCFVKSLLTSDKMHSFNVDYLILSQILAKRLKVFLTPSFRKRKKIRSGRICVTIAQCPQKIKMSFLKQSLSLLTSLKHITPTPPKDFSILENLLPKPNHSFKNYRKLRQGCPLTIPILTMALKQLESDIMATNSGNTSVCYFRQSLLISTDNETIDRYNKLIKQFKENSGIKIVSSWRRVVREKLKACGV